MATDTSNPIITSRKELSPGAYPVGAPFSIDNISIVTNTTTVDTKIGDTVTNVSYIPYMRAIDIDFVAYRLRPYRQIYHYFDNVLMDAYVQKPNIIQTATTERPNDIINGHRENIIVNGATARVLLTEYNEDTGLTRIYVGEFKNPSTIDVDAGTVSITGDQSGFTSTVVSYIHNSGVVQAGSTVNSIVLSADADSTEDDIYLGKYITIVTGPNAGEARKITAYTASTRTATLETSFTSISTGLIYSIAQAKTNWSSSNQTQIFNVTPRGYESGILHIPDPSVHPLKFRTGDRILRILDNDRNDASSYTCLADYRFTSNGLDLSKAQIIERKITTVIDQTYDISIPPTPSTTPTPSVTPSSSEVPITPIISVTTPTPSPSSSPTTPPITVTTPTPTSSPTPSSGVAPTPTARQGLPCMGAPTEDWITNITNSVNLDPWMSGWRRSAVPGGFGIPLYSFRYVRKVGNSFQVIEGWPNARGDISDLYRYYLEALSRVRSQNPGSTTNAAPDPETFSSFFTESFDSWLTKYGNPNSWHATGVPVGTVLDGYDFGTNRVKLDQTPWPCWTLVPNSPTFEDWRTNKNNIRNPQITKVGSGITQVTQIMWDQVARRMADAVFECDPAIYLECAQRDPHIKNGSQPYDPSSWQVVWGHQQVMTGNYTSTLSSDANYKSRKWSPNIKPEWYREGGPTPVWNNAVRWPIKGYKVRDAFLNSPDIVSGIQLGPSTTLVSVDGKIDVRGSVLSGGASSNINYVPGTDPIAQSFYIDVTTHPNGVFLSSVDLYFKNKGSLPLEVQIRPIVNGYPSSSQIIPGAVAVISPEEVNVSDLPSVNDTATRTRITFASPVYLNSGFEYALVVATDDYAYDYYCAELGKTAVGSDSIISKQPHIGSLFKSQNGRTWNALQDEDLMFVLNKCTFASSSGSVIFNEDKIKNNNVTYSNTVFDAFDYQSDSIEINNTKLFYNYRATSNTSKTLDSLYTEFKPDSRINMSERKVLFAPGDADTSLAVRVDLETKNTDVSPMIFHNRQNFVAIENVINDATLASENFSIVDAGSSYTTNAEMTITADAGYGANAYVELVDGVLTNVIVRDGGYGYLGNVTATLTTGGGSGASIVVNPETGTSGGPAWIKYISKTVSLVDGFDAGDLRVYLTAVKPAGANVDVYFKVRNNFDPDPIENRHWVRMTQKTSQFTYSLNGEQIEYEYRPSLTSNNIVYTTDTTTYKTFNQFAMKVVLTSSGTLASQIPYVYDLRAIALPEDAY